MALVNATLNYYHNGELADETTLGRPLIQLIANDVGLDSRLATAEGDIDTLQGAVITLQNDVTTLQNSESILQWF